MLPITYISLKLNLDPLDLENTNSGKYCTFLNRLSYHYEFLQKRQFHHNIAFMFYIKTYLLSLFLDD